MKVIIAGVLLSSTVWAAEVPPAAVGTWAFEEVVIGVVETAGDRRLVASNSGEPTVIEKVFHDRAACDAARNSINSFGFTVPLGTGGGAQAHIGRSITECYAK